MKYFQQHIEANLKNHDAADEWTAMCTTTPYDFNGLHFDGAMSCANWVRCCSSFPFDIYYNAFLLVGKTRHIRILGY